jgi:rare lipoprotein A
MNKLRAACLLIALASVLAGCSAPGPARRDPGRDAPAKAPSAEIGRGKASWYGPGFEGKRTASGERFDMNALTAAHRTLAFGTRVLVRNTQNGREVIVRINDRGPHVHDRIIDLSKAAAEALDMVQAGQAPVILIVP